VGPLPTTTTIQSNLIPSRPSVAVGISGGVDSSVTALLLKAAGFDVRGVFMRNWDASDEAGSPRCTVSDDLLSARAAADALGIPLTEVDFVAEYWSQVFEPFLESYSRGVTPNPDVSCNRFVKFGAFREHCLRRMGADFMALGHYATVWPPALPSCEALRRPDRLAQALLQHGVSSDSLPAELIIGGGAGAGSDASGSDGASGGDVSGSGLLLAPEHTDRHETGPALLASVDGSKDQSDFLCRVPGASLKRVILPLGQLHKSTVRQLAATAGLPTAGRKDSYGICFIGKRDLTSFLGNYVPLTPAEVRSVETGALVSRVDAAEVWTVGQRMPVGGTPAPLFVAACDLRGSAAACAPSAAPLGGSAGEVAMTDGDGGGRSDAAAQQRASDGPVSPWQRKRTLKPVPPCLQIEHLRAATGPVVWVARGTAHPSLLADAAAVRLRDFFPVQGRPLAAGAGGSDWDSGSSSGGGGPCDGDASGIVLAQGAPPPGTLLPAQQRMAAALQGIAAPAAVLPLIEAACERKLGQNSGASSSMSAAARDEDADPTAGSGANEAQRHSEPISSGVPSSCCSWLREGCSALTGPAGSPAAAGPTASLCSLPVRYRIRHQQMAFQRGVLLVLWASEWRRMVSAALLRVHAGMAGAIAERMRLEGRRAKKDGSAEQRSVRPSNASKAEAERQLLAAATAEAWALLTAGLSPQLRECLPPVAGGSAGATTLLQPAAAAQVGAAGSTGGSPDADAPTAQGALRPAASAASALDTTPAATEDADELLLVLACERPQRAVCPGQELVLYSEVSVLPPPQGLSSSAVAGDSAKSSTVQQAASSPDTSQSKAAAAAAVPQPAPDAGRAVYGGGPIWSAGPTVFTLSRAATFDAGKLPTAAAGASAPSVRHPAAK
jgi:tRNA U34 2-thiouridine synthase MnmA/TrmU